MCVFCVVVICLFVVVVVCVFLLLFVCLGGRGELRAKKKKSMCDGTGSVWKVLDILSIKFFCLFVFLLLQFQDMTLGHYQ